MKTVADQFAGTLAHPQLDGIAEALGWTLGADDPRRIDAIPAEHIADPVGPEFMAPPARSVP